MNVVRSRGPAAAVLFLLLATACGSNAASQSRTAATGSPTGSPTPPASATAAATAASGPSQSAADAARDGVVPALAALPFAVRVTVQQAVAAPEGVWVLSRPSAAVAKYADECRLGPADGKYPTDYVCTTEYGEVLLLDATRSRILRAYPLPAAPPQHLELAGGAVYCGRQGDLEEGELMLPDSMVCRIDRTTLASAVRVYPSQNDSVIVQPCFYPPRSWSVDEDFLEMTDLAADAQGLWAKARNGTWTQLDPTTLKVVRAGVTR